MFSTNEIILASVFIAIGAALTPLAAYLLNWIGFYIYEEKESALPSEESKIIIKKGQRPIQISSMNDEQLDALIMQLQKAQKS